MAGRISKWRGKRKRKRAIVAMNHHLRGIPRFKVEPGPEQGVITVCLMDHNGSWAVRHMSCEDVNAFSLQLSEEMWADSMRGTLPEGVLSDE